MEAAPGLGEWLVGRGQATPSVGPVSNCRRRPWSSLPLPCGCQSHLITRGPSLPQHLPSRAAYFLLGKHNVFRPFHGVFDEATPSTPSSPSLFPYCSSVKAWPRGSHLTRLQGPVRSPMWVGLREQEMAWVARFSPRLLNAVSQFSVLPTNSTHY